MPASSLCFELRKPELGGRRNAASDELEMSSKHLWKFSSALTYDILKPCACRTVIFVAASNPSRL